MAFLMILLTGIAADATVNYRAREGVGNSVVPIIIGNLNEYIHVRARKSEACAIL